MSSIFFHPPGGVEPTVLYEEGRLYINGIQKEFYHTHPPDAMYAADTVRFISKKYNSGKAPVTLVACGMPCKDCSVCPWPRPTNSIVKYKPQ